jgi:serine/threonine protein kinase
MSGVRRPLRPGAELAPGYSVISHLSRNAALDVYDAWDERRFCRCVAKLLRPDWLGAERAEQRLRNEGRLLARFSHPHIVRAYETLAAPQTIVIMETLTGETLSHMLARRTRRLALSEVAILGLQLASAVRYMHAHRWLHVDLKPSNVIVDAGFVKLFDLSLARRPGPGRAGVGTRGYLSPEQARGDRLGPATDVWGLGAVLHEVCTGAEPFPDLRGVSHPQLVMRAPAVRTRRRVPAAFGEALDACLEPDPADRPAVDDVLAALEPYA